MQDNPEVRPQYARTFLLIAALVLGLRLLMIGLTPLTDTTESRYAEIPRKMHETGDWITPQHDYGVPFWGKPPLGTWATAAAYGVFGVNEFSARIAPMLFSALALVLILSASRDKLTGSLAAMIAASSGLLFVTSGAAQLDSSLLFATTLCMTAFWKAVTGSPRARLWGYLFFAGLGIGMLAKGPVAVVLTLLPISVWILFYGKREALRSLPWLGGTALAALITLPWYIAAEIKTPGFLEYFIIGEHIKRFVVSDWAGDLYGNAHAEPLGMIWAFAIYSLLPWSLVFFGVLLKRRKERPVRSILADSQRAYFAFWALAPMVFFTPASNILPTYLLPGVPGFALLLADMLKESKAPRLPVRRLAFAALIVPVLVIIYGLIIGLFFSARYVPRRCQKPIVRAFQQKSSEGDQLFYLFDRPHSGQFYSYGRAKVLHEPEEVDSHISDEGRAFFAVKTHRFDRLPEELRNRLELVSDQGYYRLYAERQE